MPISIKTLLLLYKSYNSLKSDHISCQTLSFFKDVLSYSRSFAFSCEFSNQFVNFYPPQKIVCLDFDWNLVESI